MTKTAFIAAFGIGILAAGAFFALQGSAQSIPEFASRSEVSAAQTVHKLANGAYVQVLKGNRAPQSDPKSIVTKLGKKLPENMWIDVYRTPRGEEGYVVYEQTEQGIEAIGYGPEAALWTKSFPNNNPATTTP